MYVQESLSLSFRSNKWRSQFSIANRSGHVVCQLCICANVHVTENWTRHNCIEADQLCGNKTLEWYESPNEEPKPVPCTEGCPCELCEDVLKRKDAYDNPWFAIPGEKFSPDGCNKYMHMHY